MRVLRVDPNNPNPDCIREAASVIRSGGLVVFPTETVYGLAANALDPSAVMKVFHAKGRSEASPLPVQVGDKSNIEGVAIGLSDQAHKLAEKFMPGPITLIVKRSDVIPDIVTAGADTIGVRIPDNPVALALLRELDIPIVATSANLSGKAAPLDADEAISQIGEFVDVVLDAGPAGYGIASTVVDTTVDPPRVLRIGALRTEEIRSAIGELTE